VYHFVNYINIEDSTFSAVHFKNNICFL